MKDFSDGNSNFRSDGKQDRRNERDSRDSRGTRSFGDKPRFSRDRNDKDNRGDSRPFGDRPRFSRATSNNRSDNRVSRDSRDNRDNRDSRDRDNRSFNDRPRFSRDTYRGDSRDGRDNRDNRDNRDDNRSFAERPRFSRSKNDRDNRSFGDRPRFDRDNRDNRSSRDSRDNRDNRDNQSGYRSEYRSTSDRPRFSRDNREEREHRSFGDRPRLSRATSDNRNDRSDRDTRGNRDSRSFNDRPRFDRDRGFDRNKENRPRFDRPLNKVPKSIVDAQDSEKQDIYLDTQHLETQNENQTFHTDNIVHTEYANNTKAEYSDKEDSSTSFNTDRADRADRGERSGFRSERGDRSGFASDRGGDRPEREGRPERGGRFERAGKFTYSDRGPRGFHERSDLQEVLDLDKGILKLLAKRARFLQKLVTGKMLDATTEKTIRTSWEEHAAKFNRNSKVSRELFLLVQSVEAVSESDTEQPFFNLSPAPKPVQVELPAPTSSRITRYYMTLAAASGKETSVKNVPLTDSIIDGLKSLNFMGGDLWYENDGTVMSRKAKGLERGGDKAVHVGKDPLNLWLVLALSIGLPYHLKITGENELRAIDFSPIARFLPQLGARLVQIIPSQEGLPVRIEASGMLPEEVIIPVDLPRDFVFALLLASSFWESDIRFDMTEYFAMLQKSPILQKEWDILFEELEDVFTACSLKIRLEKRTKTLQSLENAQNRESVTATNDITDNTETGSHANNTSKTDAMYFVCERTEPQFPEELLVPSDAEICTAFFLLPAFTSGYVQLSGVWQERGSQRMIKEIMAFAGLEWTEFDGSARVKGASDAPINMPESGEIPHCPPHIATLLYTLCAERGIKLDLDNMLTRFELNPENLDTILDASCNQIISTENTENTSNAENTETALSSENTESTGTPRNIRVQIRDIIVSFLAHIGFNEKMEKVEVDNSAWLAPSAAWAVAFSLGAYMRPRLKLVNPNVLNDYYPFYWRMYNTLPNPELKKQERKHEKVASSRKRVIAQGVYADLADVPQPDPYADAE